MSINHIRLYDLFRRELHLPDDKAAEAVYAIQEITDSSLASKKDELATKEDIGSLKEDINSLKEDIDSLKEDIYSFKLETKESIYLLKSEISSSRTEFIEKFNGVALKTDLQNSSDKLYRAIYLTGMLQFITMVGMLLTIVKLLK
ncbi:MAG TPA: hypothetical protein VG890_06215 [Puia sp.]|nr:hypothetical protein [Puia sp.]